MLEPVVRHHYVKINNSLVHLVQYGHNESIIKSAAGAIEKSPSSQSEPALVPDSIKSLTVSGNRSIGKLIVFIPGNPGLLGVYHDFLVALYKTLARPSDKSNEPVLLAIGHNNFHSLDYDCEEGQHQDGRCCEERIYIEESGHNCGDDPHQIELQCLNKLVILKHLLKIDFSNQKQRQQQQQRARCKLAFVGHSMGCYIILKLLQDRALAEAHAGSVLVHPALDNLALTKKGSLVAHCFALKLDLVARLVAYGIEKLVPKSVILDITKWWCSREFVANASSIVIGSMAQLVESTTLLALIEMAKSELECVRDLDHDKMIRPHVDRLKLIYALNDHWVNADSRLELARLYPALHIEEHPVMHAFIMDPSAVANYSIKFGMIIEDFFE